MQSYIQKLFLALFFSGSLLPIASANADPVDKIEALDIKALSEVFVTSSAKRPEAQFKATSAITVISQEEIERSGATNIAEALRYVPGVNVARIDANKWAISARGFNRQYSNKLLVLVDGRSVYTPQFSGVYWDIQDTNMADIDRIEVIRGPGATLWGSNAVNGVINIITKKAQNTQGMHASFLHGDHEKAGVTVRKGGQINDHKFYRAYAKRSERGEMTNLATGNGNNDGYSQYRAGFRFDSAPTKAEEWSIIGDAHKGHMDQTFLIPGLITPAVSTPVNGEERYYGGSVTGSWEKQEGNTHHKLHSYIDYVTREMEIIHNHQIFTFDINYQRNVQRNNGDELIWGAGYRYIWDDLDSKILDNGQGYLFYTPQITEGVIYNVFLQNEVKVIPDKLHFTLGTKIEDNYYTDFEIQPNARLAWYPSDNQTVWGAVSHAIRIPTRGERTLSAIVASTPGGFVKITGNPGQFKSEELTAFELGHRYKPNSRLAFDTSAFYNIYDDLRTFEPGVSPIPTPDTAAEFITHNAGSAETFGFEIEAKYVVTPNWTLMPNYTYTKLAMHRDKTSLDSTIADEEGVTPEHQIAFKSRLNLPHDVTFDTNLSYIEELETFDIPSYTRLDARIGWKPLEGVEVSLTGQNLLDSTHPEFQPFLYAPSAEIDRSVFLKLNLNF